MPSEICLVGLELQVRGLFEGGDAYEVFRTGNIFTFNDNVALALFRFLIVGHALLEGRARELFISVRVADLHGDGVVRIGIRGLPVSGAVIRGGARRVVKEVIDACVGIDLSVGGAACALPESGFYGNVVFGHLEAVCPVRIRCDACSYGKDPVVRFSLHQVFDPDGIYDVALVGRHLELHGIRLHIVAGALYGSRDGGPVHYSIGDGP